MLSSCPFCHLDIPLPELEWHVNNHLVDDELETDMELAQQIAQAPESPRLTVEPIDYGGSSEILDQEKISCLVGLQIKGSFYKIEGGLMPLLRRCLELEKGNSQSLISGYIDHYQTIQSEDSGFGCGWRNIQMLSSHLLMQRQEARDIMFGGSGFVPDIPSLQRWLEIAWERGFDRIGSDSFKHKIYGSRKWIGATECATLFRSFGLRAKIVDFDDMCYTIRKHKMQLNNREYRGQSKVKQIYGPMDKFLYRKRNDNFQLGPLSCENSQEEHHDLVNLPQNGSIFVDHDSFIKCKGKMNGHQILVDWVWNYFTSEVCGRLNDSQRVIISEKTPLYFQHHGHSRTIVGIQMQTGMQGSQDRYSLLVLDPGQRTTDLERSLRDGTGWQKLIKRGAHTLKKQQYQLCYVDPGIVHGEEIELLKTIDSILVES